MDKTIPVFIDSIKQMEEFQRTRCLFYRVEFSIWVYKPPGLISFWSTPEGYFYGWSGGWAALVGQEENTGGAFLWDSPEAIDNTFSVIEGADHLFLDLGHLWIPNEMLKFLTNRKNIGIHSDVITDPVVDLVEQGVITGNEKTIHKGRIVASFCLGSRRLFETIDRNPMFAFYPIDYVCDPMVISKNNKMVSVSQAFALDLTGQVCSDQFQGEFYSGVSTQPDFVKNVANTPGGKPIDVPASDAPSHHTPDFFVDETGMRTGVQAMLNVALDYLNGGSRD